MNNLMSPFGEVKTDTGAGALAQLERREEAEIMAMVAVAKRFPRDERAATERIGRAFERHTLAADATYSYSRGGQEISDLNIRAMECIASNWGNMDVSWSEVSRGVGDDGVPYSLVEAKAWDLETTTRKRIQFIVRHWRDTKRGGYALKDERDIYELCANMAQRRVRACIGALIPEDVKEYARSVCDATMAAKAEVTPESIKALLEAFAEYKVTKEHIEKRLQRNIDSMQPAQLVRMRKIYRGLREGVSKPSDWFEGFEEAPPPDKSTTSLGDIAAKASPPAGPKHEPDQERTTGQQVKEQATRTPPGDLLGDTGGGPTLPDPEELIAKMKGSRKLETLDVHADWIRHYTDDAVRQRLTDHYEDRKAELAK